MGQFWAVVVRMKDRRECSDRKMVSQCCEPAGRVYYRAVVEVKKEILDHIQKFCARLSITVESITCGVTCRRKPLLS